MTHFPKCNSSLAEEVQQNPEKFPTQVPKREETVTVVHQPNQCETRFPKRNSSLAEEVQQNPEKYPTQVPKREETVTVVHQPNQCETNFPKRNSSLAEEVQQNPEKYRTIVPKREETVTVVYEPNQCERCRKTSVKGSHIVARGGSAKPKLSNRVNLEQPNAFARVEVLSQDSGLRGCWFRCKSLCSVQNRLKVRYCQVADAEVAAKLEEWVPITRVAEPDNLGLRCSGRLTVRPWPKWDSAELRFEVGAAVDAWWSNGWWEGFVIGCDPSARSDFQIYLPGENKFVTVVRTNLRASKDWIDNQWVVIRSKPDILSYLSSLTNPTPRFPVPIPRSSSNSNPRKKSKTGGSQEAQGQFTGSSSSASEKAVEKLSLKQFRLLKEMGEWSANNVIGKGKAYEPEKKL